MVPFDQDNYSTARYRNQRRVCRCATAGRRGASAPARAGELEGAAQARLVIQSPPANACLSRPFAERSEIFREDTLSRKIWRPTQKDEVQMDFAFLCWH